MESPTLVTDYARRPITDWLQPWAKAVLAILIFATLLVWAGVFVSHMRYLQDENRRLRDFIRMPSGPAIFPYQRMAPMVPMVPEEETVRL